MYTGSEIIIAFSLTLFAGLATTIGGLAVYYRKDFSDKYLSNALAFSAGVMIFVSFVEIYQKAAESIGEIYPDQMATLITALSFFGGVVVIAFIDNIIPKQENPHDLQTENEIKAEISGVDKNLLRMGIFSAVAIAIHNFPEGLATFIMALDDPTTGVGIAIAIAIHNIPEGIAVSIPIYYATKNRNKALKYSFLSGLSEPIGAFIGYLILMPFLTPTVMGVLFAAVAGIMVYISLDELLPAAHRYGNHHMVIISMMIGMFVMAISLVLFS